MPVDGAEGGTAPGRRRREGPPAPGTPLPTAFLLPPAPPGCPAARNRARVRSPQYWKARQRFSTPSSAMAWITAPAEEVLPHTRIQETCLASSSPFETPLPRQGLPQKRRQPETSKFPRIKSPLKKQRAAARWGAPFPRRRRTRLTFARLNAHRARTWKEGAAEAILRLFILARLDSRNPCKVFSFLFAKIEPASVHSPSPSPRCIVKGKMPRLCWQPPVPS